ncbi:MAG: hypothetical protein DWQ36_14040 [Acidobacteria bacterium]|nr:MAG: hypothetical protein DWQ30_19910 [Acidobacteriota bacterium]REK06327.1 MAG: hypothetical protein DWQ36_14040 [Acidobacteriota bacterium]
MSRKQSRSTRITPEATEPREVREVREVWVREDGQRGVGRRDLLQLGLLGTAAGALRGAAPAPAQPGSRRGRSGAAAGPTARPPISPQFVVPPTPVDAASAPETWIEPWVWKPSLWPGQQLQLNVVENEVPGPIVGFGNDSSVLFSYGGITPGPTIRMKGDEILFVKLRNLLGEDLGKTPVGPAPDLNELTPELDAAIEKAGGDPYSVIPADVREDFCLGEHTNGQHSAHVSNLHTHGLHVRPGRNPDGTHSDNVILRVIPQRDLERRRRRAGDPTCEWLRDPEQTTFLRDDEQVGEANYEFRIGNTPATPMHPPGTFWYHPHSHGSTHNQVSSGMAGFLLVEGDVDVAINRAMTGDPDPDLEQKHGEWDYRERLMLVQAVLNTPKDPDAENEELRSPPNPAINGSALPRVMTMRPGAVERWRVLNGSVDGRGYRRLMVLAGQYAVDEDNELVRWDAATKTWQRRTREQVEGDKQQLWQLAFDGITLMEERGGEMRYVIRDLARQNAGAPFPLAGPVPSDCPAKWRETANGRELCRYENAYRNGENVYDTYVRPNEVYMAPANRADVFFQAPRDAGSDGEVYTVLAHKVIVHADNPEQGMQKNLAQGVEAPPQGPVQIVIGWLAVSGDPCPPFDIESLTAELPPVPDYLKPVRDDELRAASGSGFRTRVIEYSGWGSQDYPLIEVPQSFVDTHPELENLRYARHGGGWVLLPAAIRSMAIDGRKFDPTDPERPRMELDTAEEWVLYNSSTMLWGDVDPEDQPPTRFKGHYRSHAISRAEGQRRFRRDTSFQITSRAVDHPFHIHQNPFWVTRIEVPDENGELHNVLPHPRWQDVVWIPRNRGRVVFRSRFPDYVGTFVEHCHLLLHEDNGMMQVLEITPFADQANYVLRPRVTSPGMSAEQISELYPRPTREQAYRRSASFVDPNHATGQVYPGFEVEPPPLEDDE